MKLRIFTEPHLGASYDVLLRVARCAENCGFDGFFRSDHYLKMGDVSGLPGPTDAWITLAGLAVETSGIPLGTLMTAATFRLPGPLAITVAQVDRMSGGRIEFGIGAGWYEAEHRAYGVPFPEVRERFERLEEQLAIITGAWATPAGERFSFAGRHYQLADCPALPKPVRRRADGRPGPPVIIGGFGARRTPRVAARYADEFNIDFRSIEDSSVAFGRVREAVLAAGRAPGSMTYSAAQIVCCGRTETEIRRRVDATGQDIRVLRENGLVGSPGQLVERINAFAKIGAERIYLSVLDLADLDHIELIASEVLPFVSSPHG